MSDSKRVSRRQFVERGSAAAAVSAAMPYIIPRRVLGAPAQPAPNDRIHIGLIGAGGMGRANLRNCARYPDVVVTGICDVWEERRRRAAADYPDSAKLYHDYREMLQQADIDAVIIATPPHWHCLQAVDACKAGKDVYLQKPMTRHLAESLAVREAVTRHHRVCQIGTQIHASENYRRVVEKVRKGVLGKVNVVRTFNVMNQGKDGIGNKPNGSPPKGLDWDRWVGPAPMRPFNELIVKSAYENGSFMDFSGGWTPGMAPHIIDLPVWALKLGVPARTSCSGGRFAIQDAGDAPDTQEVLWEYPGLTMTWSMSLVNSFGFDFGRGSIARRLGIYFHGLNGTLFANYSKHEVVPEGDRPQAADKPVSKIPPSPGHEREWLDCVKSRRQPSCNPAYHFAIDAAIALANLSMQLQRTIHFDGRTESIIGDEEAAKLAVPTYRAPWRFPTEYLPRKERLSQRTEPHTS